MEEDNSFYTKEDPEAGTHAGWIRDPSTAQEIANVQYNKGIKAAIALEKSLEETGMNPIEKENNDFADLLLQEYPYLFAERIDEKTGERYIATSRSIFSRNIRSMYRFLPHSDPYVVLDQFKNQIEDTKRENKAMIHFDSKNMLTLFSKHGRLVTKAIEDEFNPNSPICDYDPNNRYWVNFRDLDETYFEQLFKGLALYQTIGEEFDKETKETKEKRLSIDARRAQIEESKKQIKRD